MASEIFFTFFWFLPSCRLGWFLAEMKQDNAFKTVAYIVFDDWNYSNAGADVLLTAISIC